MASLAVLRAILQFCAVGAALGVELRLNETVSLNASRDDPVTLSLQLDSATQAVRLHTLSDGAGSLHPLLVTVRQVRGISSWVLPYVESGFAHHSVARTLCPLLNSDPMSFDPPTISVDISTSSKEHINFTIATTLVEDFYIQLEESTVLTASPSAPAYAVFAYPDHTDSVRVKFTSQEEGSSVCAIASIQKSFCPVVDLLDNPDHRGIFQTMQHKAAITTQLEDTANSSSPPFSFFYVVVTVFPDDGECASTQLGFTDGLVTLDTAVNYDPKHYSGEEREKRVTIIIEPALSPGGYAVATVVAMVVFFSMYIIVLFWITIFEWINFKNHPLAQHILKECERGDHGVGKGVESPPPSSPLEEVDSGKKLLRSPERSPEQGERRRQKRPSWWQVLLGRHWEHILREADPTRSPPTLQDVGDSSSPPSVTTSLNLSHMRQLRRTPSGTHYSPFPSQSHAHHVHHPSSPLTRPRLMRSHSMEARSGHKAVESTDHPNGNGDTYTRQLSAPAPVTMATNAQVHVSDHRLLRRQSSYEDAVRGAPLSVVMEEEEARGREEGGGEREGGGREGRGDGGGGVEEEVELSEVGSYKYDFDKEPLPVNLLLSELHFDECSDAIEKENSQYRWYLLTIIIFYGIPAVQLVTAYQQFLNISGNEDVCYYNTLCSHPLKINDSFTISAFNNVFSNVGYLFLGVLLALLTYRRRREYRTYQEMNLRRPPEKRHGIPQQQGVYFAIALALVAEAFMSATYHICPSKANYQFDTTYMFIMAGLGLYQLVVRRCPDTLLTVPHVFFLLAFIIVLVVLGVMYSATCCFYPLFFIVYLTLSLGVSVEIYYRWQLRRPGDLVNWFHNVRTAPCSLKHKPKLGLLVLSNLLNFSIAVYGIAVRPPDFGSYFLVIFISNLGLYLIWYMITKLLYREKPRWTPLWLFLSGLRPFLFLLLAVIFWLCAVFSYTEAVTNWLEPPAVSRNGNKDCIILGFYDVHDLWHFLSAFALFFSFLLLMSLDDNENHVTRTELRVF